MMVVMYKEVIFVIQDGDVITDQEFISIISNSLSKEPFNPSEGFLDKAMFNRLSKYMDNMEILYETEEIQEKEVDF